MRSWPSILIVLVVVLAFFLSFYLRTSEGEPSALVVSGPPKIGEVSYGVTHEDGTHFISGDAMVPSRCAALDATAALVDGVPPVVRVDLVTVADEGVCLRLSTARSFEVSIEAPEGSPVDFYGNGLLLPSKRTP